MCRPPPKKAHFELHCHRVSYFVTLYTQRQIIFDKQKKGQYLGEI